MKIEYLKEILDYYNLDYNRIYDELIEINENDSAELTEFLDENYMKYIIISENNDLVTLKIFNEINQDSINSFDEFMKYYYELKLYEILLESNHEYLDAYNNSIGTNKINDSIMKFHYNHVGFYSFNLDESENEISEFLNEYASEISNSCNLVIYESLDELFENEYLTNYYDYKFELTDESNIIIDESKKIIRNLDESDILDLIRFIIKDKCFYGDELDSNKIDEFIELINVFYDYNSIEILRNTDMNINYLNNKAFVYFTTFKKYSNADEYLLIKYNKHDENESINSIDIIENADEYISEIIDALEYYEIDSYEFNEFKKILDLI